MIRFKDYFQVQLKRAIRLMPGILIMAVVVAGVVGALAYGILNSESYRQEQMQYKLGIVGSTKDDMLTMGVELLENNDESRFMVDIVPFEDEKDARTALRDGQVLAYVLITDDFINSLNALSNDISLEYFATSGQRGITNIMMDELADIASNLVVSSENGLLCLEKEMRNAGFPAEAINPEIDQLLLLYVGAMLARDDMVEFSELGLSEGLSTPEYYRISLGLFFLLLMTFCSISFFLGKKKATYQFISSKGMGAGKQILSEYLAYLLVNLICAEIIIAAVYAFTNRLQLNTGHTNNSDIIKLGFNMTPALILYTSLAFFLFETIQGVINMFLAAFILYMGMSYISGYFYPKSFFPDVLQKIGEVLPTGVAFKYMATRQYQFILVMALYVFVFLFLSILVRRQKIK